ncbi:hypothetical protein Tco_0029953, partial [Tanacetum coccineum]
HTFWSLNEDILKITVLTTNTPYLYGKIRRIRACTHQRPRRKHDQYAVSREDQYAVLDTAYWGFLGVGTTFDIFQNIHILYLQYGVLVFSGYDVLIMFPSWSLVSAGTDTPYLPLDTAYWLSEH